MRAQQLALVNQVRKLYCAISETQSALAANEASAAALREQDRVATESVARRTALKSEELDVKARIARVPVNLAGIAPGTYYGSVNYSFSSEVRTVNVTLIVPNTPAVPAISGGGEKPKTTPSCAPSRIVPTATGLVSNFSLPTAWPTPLIIRLVDDCGAAITTGQVVAAFSDGDLPLALGPVDSTSGNYSGTWTPRATASQITVAARATAPKLPAATVQVAGQVTRNAAPVLSQNGTFNAFLPLPGSPLAPGMIVQIYGSNLAAQVISSTTIPLANSLGNTSVIIGGMQAPLYYMSPGQINAQVPFGLAPGNSYQVIVNANGALSTPDPIQLARDLPGIAAFASGAIIAQHGDGSLITETSPAAPGEYIVFYVAGMGTTNETVASGGPSPSSPLATPLDPPTLSINGTDVPIYFAGLTPTLVGLYQVNVQVPANEPNGDLQVVLTQSCGQSNMTVLPVHN